MSIIGDSIGSSFCIANSLPTLEDILQLGTENCNGAYTYAFIHIFPSTCGWINHRSEAYKKVPSKCFNSSDEALALVLLENNYEMWVSLGQGKVIDPLYTARFNKKESGQSGEKVPSPGYGGWSYTGIKRFMELKKAVEVDRLTPQRKLLEERFLHHLKSQQYMLQEVMKKKNVARTEVTEDVVLMSSEMLWMELVAIPGEEAVDDEVIEMMLQNNIAEV